MRPLATLLQFQRVLILATGVLTLAYFFVFQSLSRRASELDFVLADLYDKLVEVNLRNKVKLGLDLETLNETQLLTEKAVAALQRARQRVLDRIALDPEISERLQQPFQLLDFDQRRLQMIAELRHLASSKNVTLGPAAIAGFPEFVSGKEKAALLWAQLHLVDQLLLTAASYGPMTVKSVNLLPVKSHPAVQSAKVVLVEFPMQIELTGSMEAVMSFLLSLPLQAHELKQLKYPESAAHKPALFLNKILLRRSLGDPNEVALEAVVSGLFRHELPP